ATVITFTNNCPTTIWPGLLTGAGSPLSTTGFELAAQATAKVAIPPPFSGRFWARTECYWNSTGQFNCPTGDCGTGQVSCNGAGGNPPVSLVEFTLAADPTTGNDFYDVSLVDGFNLPVSVAPSGGTGRNCTTSSCHGNVNAVCPAELAGQCPQAYSYAYDDTTSTFSCGGGANYAIVFCPSN
ncbi:unnamed protein product, partial [Linum tenue]